MKKWMLACALTLTLPCSAMANPRLLVTGVTEYDPAKAYNGYTVMSGSGSAKLVDMNGNLVKEWDLKGGSGMLAKVYPNGHALVSLYPGYREAGQGTTAVALLDFDGNLVRGFNKLDKITKPTDNLTLPKEADGSVWLARQHHDFQLEGDSVGYYSPSAKPRLDGKMLMLTHATVKAPNAVTDKMQLQDDRIIILDKDNKIVFDWKASDHLAEFKNMLTDPAVAKLLKDAYAELGNPPAGLEFNGYDWFHINCVSWLGPNKWYEQDPVKYAMFHPDNIIADSRETSHLFIIDHKTGKVVWQVAPPFTGEDAALGPIYGVHGTHMIPKGLPGEGNILIFDNGGTTAYHKQLPPRYYSRVLEFDPVTKKIVWEYSHLTAKQPGNWQLVGDKTLFSPFISIAQRLPNGNTLITEGSKNRLIEVTPDYKIVWEYINPYATDDGPMGLTYRAYRVPYDYVPQLAKPQEVKVTLPKSGAIQIPNDNGDLAKVAPTLDKGRARFNPMTPVMLPGTKLAPAAAAAKPAAAADADQPGMKAY